jgi:hypothetical protein
LFVFNLAYKNYGEAIIGGGLESDRISINYTFASSFSKLSVATEGKHSIMLAYKWDKRRKCFRTITTPNF